MRCPVSASTQVFGGSVCWAGSAATAIKKPTTTEGMCFIEQPRLTLYTPVELSSEHAVSAGLSDPAVSPGGSRPDVALLECAGSGLSRSCDPAARLYLPA